MTTLDRHGTFDGPESPVAAPDGPAGCAAKLTAPEGSQAADEAIAAAVARLRREAADCVRLAGQARRRDLSERAAKLRDAAGVYERAALIVAARGDVALEPDPERKLPAETIDTGGLL